MSEAICYWTALTLDHSRTQTMCGTSRSPEFRVSMPQVHSHRRAAYTVLTTRTQVRYDICRLWVDHLERRGVPSQGTHLRVALPWSGESEIIGLG